MSLDVEALLDSAAANAASNDHTSTAGDVGDRQDHRPSSSHRYDRDDRHHRERGDRRDRHRERHGSRDRERDRDRDRDGRRRDRDRSSEREKGRLERVGLNGSRDVEMKSPPSDRGSTHGSHRSSRRRSRSRESERHRTSRRERERDRERNGPHDPMDRDDHHRTSGRRRSRSRSPNRDRAYHQPGDAMGRERDEYDRHRRERDRDRRGGGRRRTPSPRGGGRGGKGSRSPEAPLTEDERDRRTVFVQQLAARLRTKELIAFFEKIGPVKEAQIVKDRVSGRSKGVGYVEFKQEDSVPLAIQLTGQKLLGIPIIAQLTEAEKNRQARAGGEGAPHGSTNTIPFHRLYVGNIHFSITESDLQNVFEPFGELEFAQLQKDDQGRSRGYGFVQFRDPNQAREALEKMNGFELAGRPIRVGLGNDKFTPESTANLLQRFQGQNHGRNFQGSAFSGQGGRNAAGASSGNFDRAGGRDKDKGAGGASALDDTDVAGVNFNNYSRHDLMRRLARGDEPSNDSKPNAAAENNPRARPGRSIATEQNQHAVQTSSAPSKCVVLRNMFDPSEEEGDSWVKELEDDVRAECEEKYGHVVHISLDPNTQGDIYLKFDRVQGGDNAVKGLNGRFFGGRQISAQPVVDAVYSSLFSGTANL